MTKQHINPNYAPSGFTMVETIISVAIVGIMFTSTLNMVGRAKLTRYRMTVHDKARFLCQSLLNEIISLPYEDPPNDSTILGLESDELSATDRSVFDDVDDFHNWTATPPESPNGTPLTGFNGWTRSVSVQWVQPHDLTAVSLSETGVKRITVTVQLDNQYEVSTVAIRTEKR